MVINTKLLKGFTMKTTIDNFDIQHIISRLVNDSNGPVVGGCANCGRDIQSDNGFTDHQQAEIEVRLYRLAKYIRKHAK